MSIEIDATIDDVWRTIMDPARLEEWVTIHRKLGRHSTGAPRAGATMEQTLCLRGANFKVHWELDECTAPEHALWRGRGPARSRAETEYRLCAVGANRTRFDYRNEFHAPLGVLGAVASRALVGGLPRKEAEATLKRLKALLEKSSASSEHPLR